LFLIFVGLLASGCSTTNYSSFGPEIEAAVQHALDAPNKGDAAFSTRDAVYWLHGNSVAAERAALIDAVRSAPYLTRELPPLSPETETARISSDAELVMQDDSRVIAWVRRETFEIACPTGTLHIERHAWLRDEDAYYRISLIQGREFRLAGSKQTAQIDEAWRRLEAAARRKTRLFIMGQEEMQRPLESMKEIGIDFRGLSE